MAESANRSPLENIANGAQVEDYKRVEASSYSAAWRYCPSRWLMAHHDPSANIYTLSSHMCLADLNNDDESLLALVDLKAAIEPHQQSRPPAPEPNAKPKRNDISPPYNCRLRVYRGQKLIYSHFLDDVPSCLLVTTIKAATFPPKSGNSSSSVSKRQLDTERPLLTLAINDDVYFYHKLKPSHKLSLEDDERITCTLNKSEFDAWQMVRQNKVDVDTLRELLGGLSNELGGQQLTSHTNNFLALDTNEERNNYLLMWKYKRLSNGIGEHIMSMDTICCAAARLKFGSNVARSGQMREQGAYLNGSNTTRWNKIADLQKDGLVLGTEDRHLLIYELRSTRAHLESQYRLPAAPDHLLVERKSPASFDTNANLKSLTYKILVSCRDCRIYSIDQTYLLPATSSDTPSNQVRELMALKCDVVDMCWTCDEPPATLGPDFVVACLDRRVYCFSSATGQCKWALELELPATCLIGLPIVRSMGESNLIGVASQANRIDFYLSESGLIVDSIYLGADNCRAMTFGRFGREDNCLCLVTSSGHLLIFILKRTARFANAQCLSSAAAHAADALAACSHLSRDFAPPEATRTGKPVNLSEPARLPTAFAISKASSMSATDQALDQLQSDHNCDQVLAKSTIDAHLAAPQMQVPIKSKDFVDHIVEQSRNSAAISKVFAKQMVKLSDKIRSTMEQEHELGNGADRSDGNRLTLTKITGLGNTYRATLSLRLNLERHVNLDLQQAASSHLLRGSAEEPVERQLGERRAQFGSQRQQQQQQKQPHSDAPLIDRPQSRTVSVFLFEADRSNNNNNRRRFCQVKPFSFELDVALDQGFVVEKTIEVRLLLLGGDLNSIGAGNTAANEEDSESVCLNLYALLQPSRPVGAPKWFKPGACVQPVFISSVNIPTC